MQRGTHAAIGATTLGVAWTSTTPPRLDAACSIELVGMSSVDAQPSDPIDAARRWLSDPKRARGMEPELRIRAEQALDVAERHLRRLHLLVAEFSEELDFNDGVDPGRIAHMDELATELREFSDRLRVLLDPDDRAEDASERLARGLAAAGDGGGLRALVDAI